MVGGGLPIGILAGSAEFMDALDGGMWQYGDDSFPETGVTFFAGTFVRHPLALAADHAVLKHLKETGPALQRRPEREDSAARRRHSTPISRSATSRRAIEHFGSIFYFSFPADSGSAACSITTCAKRASTSRKASPAS